MTEQTPNDTEARAELLRDLQAQLTPAIWKLCANLGPMLTGLDGAATIIAIAAALMAAHEGPQVTAAVLRNMANNIAAPR